MADNDLKKTVANLIKTAEPALPLRPESRARVLGALAASPRKKTFVRRVVLAGAGAAIVVLALFFMLSPTENALAAFTRALAATNHAASVHIRGRIWGPTGEWRFEQWFTREGFERYDLSDGDNLVQRWLYDPGLRDIYPKWMETEPLQRYERLRLGPDLGDWQVTPLIGPHLASDMWRVRRVEMQPKALVQGEGEEDFWQHLDEQKDNLEIRAEQEEKVTPQGRLNIINVYGHHRENARINRLVLGNLMYPISTVLHPGDDVWIQLEADATTNLVRALEMSKRVGRKWSPIYRIEEIELNPVIGAEVRNPGLPPHHTETVDTWWEDRLPKILGAGESEQWKVTLHSLEANEKGDLFVTVSRRLKPGMELPPSSDDRDGPPNPATQVHLGLEAVDDLGNRYHVIEQWRGDGSIPDTQMLGLPDCRARARLVPVSPLRKGRRPTMVTITATNNSVGGPRNPIRGEIFQTITFGPLSMPQRQQGDDLIAEAIHTSER